MLVVLFGVDRHNRAIDNATDILRAEIKEQIAGLELRLTRELLGMKNEMAALTRRIEIIEETCGLAR